MVTTLLLSSINKAVEMNISTKIALSLAFVGNHISERIVISSLPYLNTRWSFWEGNFYTTRAVSHNLISFQNDKSSFFDLQVAFSAPSRFWPILEIHGVVNLQLNISVANRQNPFSLILVKNELGAVSESLGPPLSRPCPTMTIAGL